MLNPDASLTGSLANGILTVIEIETDKSIGIGDVLSDTTGLVIPGTQITGFGPNTTGGIGTYTVNLPYATGRSNELRNNQMVGAVAGNPGTMPNDWVTQAPVNGLSQSTALGQENGNPTLDLTISGTTTIASGFSIWMDLANACPANLGQTLTLSAYLRLLSGNLTGLTSFILQQFECDATGNALQEDNGPDISGQLSGTTQRYSMSATMTNAATRHSRPIIAFTYKGGVALNFTIRIYLPQLEPGAVATAPIATTGAAIIIPDGTVPSEAMTVTTLTNTFFNVVDPGPLEYTRLLPTGWEDNPFWQQLFAVLADINYQEIDNSRRELASIRDFETAEDWYAVLSIRLLGFPASLQDFNTELQHTLLIRSLSTYNLSRGASGIFINFLGYLLNAFISIIPLWTAEFPHWTAGYVNFVNNSAVVPGTEVWNGGSFYPTPVLNLTYDSLAFPLNVITLSAHFYNLAPIHLILNKIIGTISSPTDNLYITPVPAFVEVEIYAPAAAGLIAAQPHGQQLAWLACRTKVTATPVKNGHYYIQAGAQPKITIVATSYSPYIK